MRYLRVLLIAVLVLTLMATAACNKKPTTDKEGEQSTTGSSQDAVLDKTNGDEDVPELPESIRDLYSFKEVEILLEGMPERIVLYPYGEIAPQEGMARYVIYIEDAYRVEQQDNLLRATFPFDNVPVPVFLEITQVKDIPAEEMVATIMANTDYRSYIITGFSTEDFPYTVFWSQEGDDYDSKVTNVLVRDNDQGGSFLITMQFFSEAEEGHGARLWNSIRSLEMF